MLIIFILFTCYNIVYGIYDIIINKDKEYMILHKGFKNIVLFLSFILNIYDNIFSIKIKGLRVQNFIYCPGLYIFLSIIFLKYTDQLKFDMVYYMDDYVEYSDILLYNFVANEINKKFIFFNK